MVKMFNEVDKAAAAEAKEDSRLIGTLGFVGLGVSWLIGMSPLFVFITSANQNIQPGSVIRHLNIDQLSTSEMISVAVLYAVFLTGSAISILLAIIASFLFYILAAVRRLRRELARQSTSA